MNKMIAKFAITIILLFSQYGFLCANPVDMQMPKDTVKTDTSSSDTSIERLSLPPLKTISCEFSNNGFS